MSCLSAHYCIPGSTLRWLSRDATAEVTGMLYSAIAPMMVNGCSKGVLRQISVVAGNLSCSKKICERVFEDVGGFSRSRQFVETLACISLGYPRPYLASGKVPDYEIGTRRECMRALLNIARHATIFKVSKSGFLGGVLSGVVWRVSVHAAWS